jgi:hypothetical protein
LQQFVNKYFADEVKQAASFSACLQMLTGLRTSKTFPFTGYSFFQVFVSCIDTAKKSHRLVQPVSNTNFYFLVTFFKKRWTSLLEALSVLCITILLSRRGRERDSNPHVCLLLWPLSYHIGL